jgi:hypothetical protein
VCSYANCGDCKKCFFAQNYTAITAFLIALACWLYNPFPSYASTQNTYYYCYALVNNGNRISSVYVSQYSTGFRNGGGVLSGQSTINNRPVTLALVRDFCHDGGGLSLQQITGSILATRVVEVPHYSDHTDHIQNWHMSQVANRLGCSATSVNGKVGFPGINQVTSMLPASPANMRIPTLITKMAGQNSLAGNLAIELYSGVWQFLGILTSFKLFKIFFKGG